MRWLVLSTLALVLAACDERPQLITSRQVVVLPEESMYACARFTNWPDASRLTSVQVSRTVLELYQLNEQCYASQQAIRKFLEDARSRVNPGAAE